MRAPGDSIPDDAALPRELYGAIPWVAAASALSLAQWVTLPLAASRLGAHAAWWLPLAVGALLRQAAAPALRAAMTLRTRPLVLRLVASRALSRGAFEAEPSLVAALTQRVEHTLSTGVPALAGGALTTMVFGALLTKVFPASRVALVVVAGAASVGLRGALRGWLDVTADRLLDATRAEGQWLHAAARGRWEITGGAKEHFLARLAAAGVAVVKAESDHHARLRVVRSGQVALFAAPAAWMLWERASSGAPVGLREWALVVPALAPAIASLRALDDVVLARRALRRLRGAPTPAVARDASDAADAIELRGVTVRYGDRVALASVTLTIPARGVTAIVGPNGAGKSTLARVLAGDRAPDEGACEAGGVPMAEQSPDDVALVPQQPCFVERATVLDNVRLAAPHASPDDAARALAALGLAVPADHPASGMSRGEQRRVAIARALLRDPRWLVLDEPDAWLDREGRDALWAVLRDEGARRAVVLITHRADLVDRADRVVVLSAEHRVEAVGTAREVLESSPTGRALRAAQVDESLLFAAER